MKGKYSTIIVLAPIFLLVIYVYWTLFFQNVLKSQSADKIPFGSVVELGSGIPLTDSLIVVHFYDPNCLIAQDNIDHLKLLVDRYTGREASWFIVSNKSVDVKEVHGRLGFQPEIVVDPDGKLASILGVISTPMFVIIDDGKLYFRGTYVKNGAFCGADDITTSNAGIALRSSMKGNQLPIYLKDMKTYIGCPL